LIDQVRFNPEGTRQEARDEHLGKTWLIMKDADHLRLLQPHDLAFRHRLGCRQPSRLARQTSFAKEFVRPYEGNNGLFAML
jgi:hypothetical protein